MSTQTPSTTEQLVVELYRIAAVQRQVFRGALADIGGPVGIPVLGAIRRHGAMRVSEVATTLGVDLSVASRQVSTLEAAGHLRREPDPTDRRATLVALTDSGVELVLQAHGCMVESFGGVLEGWSEADVAALASGLERLRGDLEGELAR